MQEIKELIHVLKQNQLNYQTIIDNSSGVHASKALELLEYVDKGSVLSDDEAGVKLFSNDKDGSKYRRLKADVKNKLYEAVMQLNTNQSKFTDYQKAYYNCHRQWVVVKILTGLNANTAAMGLANRLFKTAEKYSFTLLCMDILSYLSVQYGVRENSEKKYQQACQQFNEYVELYQAESKAERYYTELIVLSSNNHAAKEKVYQQAIIYTNEVDTMMDRRSSYKLQMYGYLIRLLCLTSQNDYVKGLSCASEAIRFFSKLPYEARVPLQIFYYQELVCYIQLRRFGDGAEAAKKCISLMTEGSFNWFKYQDLYFLLLLHTEKYDQAGDVLKLNLNHSKFEFLPENIKEIWGLYEAYMHYLYICGKTTYSSKFKLAKFISDTSILTKDKGGRNVAIIIIRFLILLKEDKLNLLLDDMESINQYCYNYLRSENTKRSFALIKMLLMIPMTQYDPDLLEEKVRKHKSVLNESPFDINNQTYEIEILPFEVLWSLAMEGLNQRKEKLVIKKSKK